MGLKASGVKLMGSGVRAAMDVFGAHPDSAANVGMPESSVSVA
jgi:hypothetical protein